MFEFIMKKNFRIILVIILTSIATFVISAYLTNKNTVAALVTATYNIEAFNGLHRIESWDRLEQLLVKSCNKEALEYVRIEQSLGLSSLKSHLDNGAKLDEKIVEKHRSIIQRAKSFLSKGKYDIPTCK
jgi:hypothetical protein